MCKTFSALSFILELQSLYIKKNKWKVLIHNTFHLNYLEIIFAIKLPLQQPVPLQKILCKWEMREVIGNICKTFPYIFIVYYFFLLPLVKS